MPQTVADTDVFAVIWVERVWSWHSQYEHADIVTEYRFHADAVT